ncbi:hypothetical protein QBC45DRAFT_400412 [Copromyces sp. CBS 386.78]|nr:hypothetical protein QBC45DRAFT_400412 [Copromyces sp. CBS 386.78]
MARVGFPWSMGSVSVSAAAAVLAQHSQHLTPYNHTSHQQYHHQVPVSVQVQGHHDTYLDLNPNLTNTSTLLRAL